MVTHDPGVRRPDRRSLERRQADRTLQESVERYRSLFESLDCVFLLDLKGRFIDANWTAVELLGYEREELLSLSPSSLVDGDQVAVALEIVAELKKTGSQKAATEFRVRRKTGEYADVETKASVILRDEQPYAVLVVGRDITERKQAEDALRRSQEQLRQSQKMEAVGQLAGGIAHDFNNLLATILGYSEMILGGGASSPDGVRLDVEEIKAAAERAATLTKQILAFSRRQALRPTVVSLNEVVAGMEPLLRSTLGEDIDFVSLMDPDLGYVEADVNQFEQALMNLVVNARDAMMSEGRLTLETANAEFDQEYCQTHPEFTPGSYVMLAVSDTGAGMDEATLGHIFEPFFTTKAPGAGTGLGLATVYGIVKQSNGSISVHSEPGKGTSFKVYLPRAAQAVMPAEIVIPPRESIPGSETVLVVEDETALRLLVERILGGAGYTTFAFASAVEALEALERGECSVDLLLTDITLSGALQGDDLARAVLAARPDLPILFMSGYPRDAIVHAGRLDEGVNFLEKPFTSGTLTAMVRKVLDGPRTSG